MRCATIDHSSMFTTTDSSASLHFGPPGPRVLNLPVCPVLSSLLPKRNPACVKKKARSIVSIECFVGGT